ncbi:MAG TPA: hypothetical protein PJ982_09280 [Lacipirellulaceae bacterium]|nr:hypothetical protein [Lacipirellulaceae bacterium]
MGRINETIRIVNSAARTGLVAVFMAAAGFAGWHGYKLYNEPQIRLADKQREVDQLAGQLASVREDLAASTQQVQLLATEVELKKAVIAKLETAMGFLKLRHRIARLYVTEQVEDPATGELVSTIEFYEVDDNGQPLNENRQRFEIVGDRVYVECLVVKFDDKFVEQNALDRNTAICLFQRIFGEQQEPRSGFPIDQIGSAPASYGRYGEPSEFERRIWAEFWTLAGDPARAAKLGIRAAHADAPSIRVRKGVQYELELRTTGEFTLRPLDEQRAADAAA